MSQQPADLFWMSCGATAPLELNISGPGWAEGQRCVFDHPFILVGRHERSSLRLEDEAISRRHAYLQQLGGSVFCVDLGSRAGIRWGGEPRLAGWLRPGRGIQIGPYALELARTTPAREGSEEGIVDEGDPLQDRTNDPQFLPWLTVEMDGEVRSRLCMNRVMVLVGSAPTCRVRLRDGRVSKYHCSLVRTPQGIWLIDLLSGTGTFLNDQALPWALVKEGDRVQVGPYVLRVQYQDVHTQSPLPSRSEIPAEAPVQPVVDTPESEQRPSQDQGGLERAATEVSVQVQALQAELDQARERLRDAELLSLQLAETQADCDALREQVSDLEVGVAGMAVLQAQFEAAEARASELENERDRWQTETQALQARLAAESAEKEEWQKRLEATEQQLVEERQAVRAAEERLDQESTTLQRVRADLAAWNAEHDAALQRLQEAQDELAHAQDEARRLQAERDQALERQREGEVFKQKLAEVQAENDQLCTRIPELEGRANEIDRLRDQLREADSEMERLQVQLRTAESQAAELEGMRAECDRLREQVRALEVQLAEMTALQTQLEAAQASAGELDVLRSERDRWQTEAQARVSDLERALAEAAATHKTALEEAHDRWNSERQALEARLEMERQSHNGVVQAAIRNVQAQAAAEREEWRQRLEGAELQLVWERGMFQERGEQIRRQAANLQAERDHLAAQLAQAELRLRMVVEPSPD